MYVEDSEVRAIATQMTVTALSAPTLEALILRASRMFDLCVGVDPEYFEGVSHPVWQSLHAYAVGDIVTPTTGNLHRYRVTTAGISGASEPVFPTGSAATVTNGTVVFTENGADLVATPRAIYGDGTNFLKLPPYVPGSLTTVGWPADYTAQTYIEREGYLVRADSGVMVWSSLSGWYRGVAITVTAKWGFAETPQDVKAAIIELVINLWRETDPAFLKIVNIEGQPLRETLPPRVKEIAKRYRVKNAVFV